MDPNDIISGVICKKCNKTLPDHTVWQHMNLEFMKILHPCHPGWLEFRLTFKFFNEEKDDSDPTKIPKREVTVYARQLYNLFYPKFHKK